MTQSVQDKTLDLYGASHLLPGAGLAAVGLWSLAVGYFLIAAMRPVMALLRPRLPLHLFLRASVMMAWSAQALIVVGALILCCAGIGREARGGAFRWVAMLGIIAALFWHLIFIATQGPLRAGRSFAVEMHSIFLMSVAVELLRAVAFIFAMVYALVVARQRQSRSLRIASALIFAVATVAELGLCAMNVAWTIDLANFLKPSAIAAFLNPATSVFDGAASLLLALYFAALAIRVRKMRADPAPVAPPMPQNG